MSQGNVELVRQAFEGAGVRGLRETAETYWHAEVEYVQDLGFPASKYQGRDGVLRCFRNYLEALRSRGGSPNRGRACLRCRYAPGAVRSRAKRVEQRGSARPSMGLRRGGKGRARHLLPGVLRARGRTRSRGAAGVGETAAIRPLRQRSRFLTEADAACRMHAREAATRVFPKISGADCGSRAETVSFLGAGPRARLRTEADS